MFCALNGATFNPCCLKIRQSAVTRTLFPTEEPVPWTIIILAGIVAKGEPKLARKRRLEPFQILSRVEVMGLHGTKYCPPVSESVVTFISTFSRS